jgi:uncharacterized metal-binding protein YceD (DUF177 family)
MTEQPHTLPLARLPRARDTAFDLMPDTITRERIGREMDLLALKKLRLSGRLSAEGRQDWRLEATLGATVVQPCVVTLEPVTTRIDVPILRRFVADLPEPEPAMEEHEMPEDDTLEPLPPELDLEAILIEALALNLPLYPRKDEAALGEAVFAAPGVTPMRDEDAKPLAGLAALKARLEGGNDPSE